MKYKALLMSPLGLIPAGLQPATAADLPVKAPHIATAWSWAGWYAGVNAGVIADQSKEGAFVPTNGVGAGTNYCWANNCAFSNSQTAVGILGGGQIGYNFQSGMWVYGAEVDFGFSSARKSTTTVYQTTGIVTNTATEKNGIDALGTARLRLGYAFDRSLIYATGGLAYGHSLNSFQGGNGYSWSDAGWRAGYTVGGGLEYALTNALSIKGEGLYYDLGKKDHVSGPLPAFMGLNDHMTGWVARIGLNYFFH